MHRLILTIVTTFLALTLQAQTPESDSLSQDSLRKVQGLDERDRPLGDTTAVYYYYINQPQERKFIDTSLNGFEYPQWQWRNNDLGWRNDLGKLGTPGYQLLWNSSEKAGFRTGLDAFEPFHLHPADIPYFEVGGKRPYTDLYYSQINLKNVFLKANFAHQATPYIYYSLNYGLMNYNGYFSGQRSRHQNVAVNLRILKGHYGAYFNLINTAINQSENGGLIDNALDSTSTLFLETVPVNLNINSDGSPKNENRHLTIQYRHFWRNAKADTSNGVNHATFQIEHLIRFENNRYKYFDKKPESDSSFYDFFQTNNRGIRHYILHQLVENELSYTQALGGNLQKSPLVLRLSASHTWHRVFQEPQLLQIHNLALGASLQDRLNGPFNYYAEGKAVNSRLGLDFWIKGRASFRIKDWVALGGQTLFQRYEPSQITRQLYISRTLVWEQASSLKQTQEFTLQGFLAWPKWWGRFEVANHTITQPIYFDSTMVAKQWSGSANILQLRLKQDLHVWKFHLENEVSWQRILAGKEIVRLPELMLQHKLYFESRVFKTIRLRTGATMRYMSSFTPNAYMPILGQFYVQNTQTLKFYPIVDIFVSMKIWQLRFFVNAENLTYYLFQSQNYYTTPNYAMPNWFVRFGASWQLFD